MMSKMFAAACLVAASVSVAHAGVTVVGFETLPGGVLAPDSFYDEAGFRFTTVSGNTFGGGDSSVGNPGTAFWVGYQDAPNSGETVRITRPDGRHFSLESVEHRSFTPAASDQIQFTGLVMSSTVETSPTLSTASNAYSVFNTTFTSFFDEIQMVVAASGSTSLLLDNMSFSVAPLPVEIFTDGFEF